MVLKVAVAAGMLPAAVEVLRQAEGVETVEPTGPRRLRLTYDVSRTGWSTLREDLRGIGAYSPTGLLARWRNAWREFREQNVRENLRHTPACCSKPPPGAGRR